MDKTSFELINMGSSNNPASFQSINSMEML
jgi:hypothetical protein